MNPSRFEDSPLGRAKTIITIFDAWKRLNLPGTPKRSCRAPWRDDKKPSLSIFENGHRFKDHGLNISGDVVDFVMRATNVTKSEAAHLIISWASFSRTGQLVRPSNNIRASGRTDKIKQQRKHPSIPFLEHGSIHDLTSLRISRHLPRQAPLEILHQRGLLGFTNMEGVRCWILTDSAKRNAQVRPIEPTTAKWSMKAKTLPGSDTSWPIGAADIDGRNIVFICEGPPDLLAVATAAYMERDGGMLDDIAFIAMTGSSSLICKEALEYMRDKECRFFIHNDPSGCKAACNWYRQLDGIAGNLSCWTSELEGEDFNDFAARHWITGAVTPQLPFSIIPCTHLSKISHASQNHQQPF